MWVRPPADEILDAVDPGLAETVGDRRAALGRSGSVVGIEPVEPLAAGLAGRQIGRIGGGSGPGGVGMRIAITPIGHRPPGVDAHHGDRRRRPERIERKAQLARCRNMRAVLCPVGRVGDRGLRAKHGLHLVGETDELGRCRVDAGGRAQPGDADHLGGNDESVDATRLACQRRIVQRHAPQAPVPRAAEQRRHLGGAGGGAVRRAGPARCRIAGDAAAPGESRLRRETGRRVRQGIALRHVHLHERIEHHGKTASAQVADRRHDGPVGRRAAEGRRAAAARDRVGAGAIEPGD